MAIAFFVLAVLLLVAGVLEMDVPPNWGAGVACFVMAALVLVGALVLELAR